MVKYQFPVDIDRTVTFVNYKKVIKIRRYILINIFKGIYNNDMDAGVFTLLDVMRTAENSLLMR